MLKNRLMSMKSMILFALIFTLQVGATTTFAEQSVARQWNEDLLEAIRLGRQNRLLQALSL